MGIKSRITPGGMASACLCLAVFIAVSTALANFNDGRGQVRSGSVSGNIHTPRFTATTGGESRLLTSTTLALVAGDTTSTINPTTAWELIEVRLTLDSDATTNTPFVAQVDHGSGPEFDVKVIFESMLNDSDFIVSFSPGMSFRASDSLNFSFLNDDATTLGLEVLWRALP